MESLMARINFVPFPFFVLLQDFSAACEVVRFPSFQTIRREWRDAASASSGQALRTARKMPALPSTRMRSCRLRTHLCDALILWCSNSTGCYLRGDLFLGMECRREQTDSQIVSHQLCGCWFRSGLPVKVLPADLR